MADPHGHHRPSDQPQKYGSIVLGAAAIFIAGWMTYESMEPHPVKPGADAGPVALAMTSAAPVSKDGPVIMLDASAAALDLDAGLTMPAFSLDASLPSTAPRTVKIGVVLVSFAGAEGAPPGSRPKGQAKEIADGLLSMARADFHQAVGKGDTGSADDIGRVPRGVLDPAVEAAVFALGTSDVSEVIDTPRGYWIVKRLD